MTVYYEVEKSRNELRFIREDNKYCFIDLNDGSIHGFSGKVVKNYPTGVKTCMDDMKHEDSIIGVLCGMIGREYPAELIGTVERIAVATNIFSYNLYRSADGEVNAFNNMKDCNISEALVIKTLRKEQAEWKESYPFTWSMSDVVDNIAQERLFGENGRYHALVEEYGLGKVKNTYNQYNRYTNMIENNPNWLYRMLKYQEDALFNRLIAADILRSYQFSDVLQDIVRMCDEMGTKLPKGNLLDEYELLKNNYAHWKNATKQQAFQEVQSKISSYENDEFVALIPYTIEEVVKEGNEQRNCAGGYWLNSYGNSATKFNRGMIFVRKKSNPEKSYITCDFDVSTGIIKQYLYACNNYVHESAELNFKSELQQHLLSCLRG